MKHLVPEELRGLLTESEAALGLRDAYTKRPFGFKKALKAGILSREKEIEFWRKLRELYPELGKKISVNRDDWTIETIE